MAMPLTPSLMCRCAQMYEERKFTDNGINHYHLQFPDGTCPPEAILKKFIGLAEAEPGALAVHCKAGLGRTGVLICCYMMKHFGFTAEESLGYIRIVRPGSVIGPQQQYLREYQQRMWKEGEIFRQRQVGCLHFWLPPIPPPRIAPSPGSITISNTQNDATAPRTVVMVVSAQALFVNMAPAGPGS